MFCCSTTSRCTDHQLLQALGGIEHRCWLDCIGATCGRVAAGLVFHSLRETVVCSSVLLALLGHVFEFRLQPSLLSLHAVIDLFAVEAFDVGLS